MTNDALTTTVTALVPENKEVQALSKHLRWSPERCIVRIKRALPAVVEQQIYLNLAADFGLLPESMAKLLRYYLGEKELQLEDLDPRPIGNNLHSSKFTEFTEFLRECLSLIKIISGEYSSFSLSIEHAAVIVTHYGVDEPELLIDMVDNHLEELCEMLGVNNQHAYSHRMRTCIWLMATRIIPENKREGRPDILDVSDILEYSSMRRRELRMAILEELPDYLGADSEELRGYPSLDLLKKLGVI